MCEGFFFLDRGKHKYILVKCVYLSVCKVYMACVCKVYMARRHVNRRERKVYINLNVQVFSQTFNYNLNTYK